MRHFTIQKCIQLLEEKLEKHELNLHTDIVAIITDGANVMNKVGRIINIDKQLCFAHGVQLGVTEALHKKLEMEQYFINVRTFLFASSLH